MIESVGRYSHSTPFPIPWILEQPIVGAVFIHSLPDGSKCVVQFCPMITGENPTLGNWKARHGDTAFNQ